MDTKEGATLQYRLVVFGDGSVRTLPLLGNRWIVGRATDCDVPLRDPTVSRRHLQIERIGDEFRFQDLGGSNPALLDGRPTKQATLRLGQVLAIGLTRLVLEQRQRPTQLTPQPNPTVVLSREVIDDELPPATPGSFPATAVRVLDRIEWTFADLGDLTDAAEPLLDLALNLTGRTCGWLGRFLPQGGVETLAVLDGRGQGRVPSLPEAVLNEARRIARPHLLVTREASGNKDRLVVPLGDGPNGLVILEEAQSGAPQGQDLLRMANSLGAVIWHRLQETTERLRLRSELQRLRFHGTGAHNALLASNRLQDARQTVRSFANSDGPVLLIGEEGTEREDLARYLHAEGSRREGPFLQWNAAKVPDWRHQKELFGDARAPGGVWQRARGGTLFVDNADRLLPATQEQLLIALQVTFSAAADASPALVLASPMGLDGPGSTWTPPLAERLRLQQVAIPPLRSDGRDVLALAELMLSEMGTGPDGSPRLMTERTKRLLVAYSWPGNVRELRLVLEAAAAQAGNQPISPRHLPPAIGADPGTGTNGDLPTLEELERQHITEVMQRTGGNRTRAALILGIASSTLYEKVRRYRIEC